MRQRVHYDSRNLSTIIIRGPVVSGRQIVLGDNRASKPVKKTKKGAADLLRMDDKRVIFSPEQREVLLNRAGKAYGTPRTETSPLVMRKTETETEYVKRINAHIARLGT